MSYTSVYVFDVPYISDEAVLVFKWAVIIATCTILDMFGIVTNSINMICILKQGFHEPINVSLFGLAICDLCSLVTAFVLSNFYTLLHSEADVPFHPLEVAYLVGALPHFVFTRVSAWITAIITIERCVCIIAPLKVNRIITPGRVKAVLICTFIVLASAETPVYCVNRLVLTFSPARNRTVLSFVVTPDHESVQMITFTINNFILPLAAFVVIIVCTLILVINLQKRTAWRKISTAAIEVSSRNQKVGKMVVMISALFISCFIPCAVSMLALAFEPGLNLGGQYFNIGIVIFGVGLVTESINSSTNIFIYYHMSSKYRYAFRIMFTRDSRKLQG